MNRPIQRPHTPKERFIQKHDDGECHDEVDGYPFRDILDDGFVTVVVVGIIGDDIVVDGVVDAVDGGVGGCSSHLSKRAIKWLLLFLDVGIRD